MQDYEKLLYEYNKLKHQYEDLKKKFMAYKNEHESIEIALRNKNNSLSKKIDSLTNILEISSYINSNISNPKLISIINDMIIGILGVKYSSIYLFDQGELKLKASNASDHHKRIEKIKSLSNNYFILNSKKCIFDNIHSAISAPIYINKEIKGYILVEHNLYNFFNFDHMKFILNIADQIAIAIQNNLLYRKVKESSLKDPLLDTYNRKYFIDIMRDKIKKSKNEDKFAIVMIDIDNFKKINDTYGHVLGDKVLIRTVDIIKSNISKNDIIARYGGEEFLIYISEYSNKKSLISKIDKIRHAIYNDEINYNNISCKITASFGISYYPENGDTIERLIEVADYMMYKAKKSGKNKIVSA